MESDKIVDFEQLEMSLMDTSEYVYKSHNIIESGYNFTLNEQRLTYLATKKLKPRFIKSNIKTSQLTTLLGNEKFKDLKIHVNEFRDEFGLSSNNLYKVLEDTAKSLKKKEINYLQDDGSFVEKSWVITSKYNEKGKYVELTFHPDLILDLLVFKGRFGKLQFNATKTFKTSYAFRVYELLQNYAYKGFREIELEELRYKLGIFDDKKYQKYSEFDRNVLKPSVKSINESTELIVSYETRKYGRKVGKIIFKIEKNNDIANELTSPKDDIVDKSMVENMRKITKCELTAGQVSELTTYALESIKRNKLDTSFYEYIEEQTKRVEEYNKVKKINNYYGALCASIRDYWIPNIIKELNSNTSFNNFEGRDYANGTGYAGMTFEELEDKLTEV